MFSKTTPKLSKTKAGSSISSRLIHRTLTSNRSQLHKQTFCKEFIGSDYVEPKLSRDGIWLVYTQVFFLSLLVFLFFICIVWLEVFWTQLLYSSFSRGPKCRQPFLVGLSGRRINIFMFEGRLDTYPYFSTR